MAETMTSLPRRGLAAVAMLAMAAGALAQDSALPDPTRPPVSLSAPLVGPGGPSAPSAQPQLQSILISLRAGGRRVAVIDGKTLRQGDRIGSAVVESIHATEVVLRTGKQRQALKLFRPAARRAAV